MQKVYVGLSGGVDSAVSAGLLKREGYDVIGVFIKIWQPEFLECTWREDRLDAMRVAAALEIPYREIDLSDEYQAQVVQAMISEYEKGLTPNPDVLCNEKIKFGMFQRWALGEGADYVATGHYARIQKNGELFDLLAGRDRSKDQSYFLYRLGQEQLAHALFPIGEFEKSRVRKMASEMQLPVANRADSQGLCFVGDVSLPEFLSRYISVPPGEVLDTAGTVVGSHKGAAFYTVGQRHGFDVMGISANYPQYVVQIDTGRNTLTVSSDKTRADRKEVEIRDSHWITQTPVEAMRIETQVRYHGARIDSKLHFTASSTSIRLDEPQIVSSGQSAVCYLQDICLGGGIAM